MTSVGYELDHGPALSLDWTSGEHTRIEPYDGFTLVGWSTRLPPVQALRLLRHRSEASACLSVLFANEGLLTKPVAEWDTAYVGARTEQVQLLRLENECDTLLWERAGQSSRRGSGPGGDAEIAVLSSRIGQFDLEALIRDSATLRITYYQAEIVDLASRLLSE